MIAYYNEFDKFAAQWLRNLIAAGEIAHGTVDERDIWDVTPTDLDGHDRCHFFAGIAGWDYALRLAGWPEDLPIWTGSCPCQPFSAAGKRGKGTDERHLWPAWFHLIRVCRPPIIFGEQVASNDGLKWLDLVFADLEAEGYAVGAADLCAAGVGAPHIRQRLWFVAISEGFRYKRSLHDQELSLPIKGASPTGKLGNSKHQRYASIDKLGEPQKNGWVQQPEGSGSTSFMAIPNDARCQGDGLQPLHGRRHREGQELRPSGPSSTGLVADACGIRPERGQGSTDRSISNGDDAGWQEGDDCPADCGQDAGELADACNKGLSEQRSIHRISSRESQSDEGKAFERGDPPTPWSTLFWLPCRDGRYRPTEWKSESEFSPLADGLFSDLGYVRAEGQEGWYLSPLIQKTFSRVGRLKAYGNAINPWVASEFIRAVMEFLDD